MLYDEHLNMFLQVADAGSFSKAADSVLWGDHRSGENSYEGRKQYHSNRNISDEQKFLSGCGRNCMTFIQGFGFSLCHLKIHRKMPGRY